MKENSNRDIMKTIGLIPSIIERRNSNNLIIDNNLIKFLRKCFPKHKLQILNGEKQTNKLDLIISSVETILNNRQLKQINTGKS